MTLSVALSALALISVLGPPRAAAAAHPQASVVYTEPSAAPPPFGAHHHTGSEPSRVERLARLSVRQPGRYRFAVEGAGVDAALRLAGDGGDVLAALDHDGGSAGTTTGEWVALERGEYPLRLVFEGRGGVGLARVLWERADDELGGFPPEPLPARALLAPEERTLDDARSRARLDLFLAGERARCGACHADSAEEAAAHRDAPRLDGLGARVGADWLRRWLANPHALKPATTMPRVFHGAAGDAEAVEALVHRLLADAPAEPGPRPASEDAVLAEGRTLYHRVGCVACHGALEAPAVVSGDPYLSEEVPAVAVVAPFGDQAGKWRLDALSAFLRDPHATRPDGRMPSLSLSDDEADRLASYLASRWGVATGGFEADPALVERGTAEFRARGCASCHTLADLPQPAPIGRPASAAAGTHGPGGAFAYVAEDGGPAALEPTQLDLVALLLTASGTSAESVGVDPVGHATGRYACLACHELDGVGGPPDELDTYFVNSDERVDLGDEGRYAPDLDGVGWKLNTPWFREVLVDGGRARPYMDLRMPQYGEAHVGHLPEAFAHRDGVAPNSDLDAMVPTDDAVVVGRQLMGHEWFNCMACHVYGDYPPSGSPGPAITQFGERLRYEWYSRYLRNPQRFKPGSRMPDFGTGDRSSLRTILDGDYDAQLDAMWAYFLLGEEMPAPEGVERGGGLQLVVGDRPLVHRAFLADVGARGIAVGLPIGAHFAFDAVESRVVYAWRGDFLDASGSWAGRGGNTLGGQGDVFWRAGESHPLALVAGGEPVAWRFGGYRLDDGGYPTFLYHARGAEGEDVRVQERFEVRLLPEPRLARRFTVTGMAASTRLRVQLPPATERELTGGRLDGPSSRDLPPSLVTLAADSPAEPLTIAWEVTP